MVSGRPASLSHYNACGRVPNLVNRTMITDGGTMRYLMLVLFLSAALYAQTPPAPAPNQQSDNPPAVVELGRPDAVQPGGSLQSTPDWLGVPAAPGGSTHLAVPKWRWLPSVQPAKVPSAKGKPSIFGLNRGTPGPDRKSTRLNSSHLVISYA